MEGLDLFSQHQWQPFSFLGFIDPFFNLDASTLISTWIMMALLFLCIIILRFLMIRNHKVVHFLVTSFVRYFEEITIQTLGEFSPTHFHFITSIFMFLAFANCIAIIPYIQEPSANLNTTLSLGLISFLYIQVYAIKRHGLWLYIKEYFSPFFLMFPLHVMGKLATIISMSFRLFGNIFGGATIMHIWMSLIKSSIILEGAGLLLGLNITITLFFGVFEGLLQAFVFSMLTLTYLSIALQHEEPESEDHHTHKEVA